MEVSNAVTARVYEGTSNLGHKQPDSVPCRTDVLFEFSLGLLRICAYRSNRWTGIPVSQEGGAQDGKCGKS